VADPHAPGPPGPDWLGRLAHDLRNPITPMRSAVQLLQLGQLPADIAPDLLRTLDRQLDLLLRMIDDVNDLVRIERGTFALQVASCDLGQVAASAVARAVRTAGNGTPEATLDAPPAPVWARADEVRLRQALEVLLALVGGHAAPAPAAVVVDAADGAGRVRLSGGGATLAADPRVAFLAGGPAPADAALLTFAHLVARHILAAHGATLAIDDDGTTLSLRVPGGDSSA